MGETPDGLAATFEYNSDLFEAFTIERWSTQFLQLLDAIVADPDRRLSAYPLLSDEEQHQILVQWNDTAAAFQEREGLHQLFEAQVRRSPDATAVAGAQELLTYRELNRRANQLARRLRAAGVGREVRVALCLDRAPRLLVGLLAVLKAGGAYVPLDPIYPPERLQPNRRGLPTRAVAHRDRAAPAPLARAAADALPGRVGGDGWPGARVRTSTLRSIRGKLLMCCIPPGRPAGRRASQSPQRALVNFLESMRRAARAVGEDVLLAVTTLSFDIAALELFLPLDGWRAGGAGEQRGRGRWPRVAGGAAARKPR